MLAGTGTSGGGGLLAERKDSKGCGIGREFAEFAERFAAVSILRGFFRLWMVLVFVHIFFSITAPNAYRLRRRKAASAKPPSPMAAGMVCAGSGVSVADGDEVDVPFITPAAN